MTQVRTGLDRLRDGYWKTLKGCRLGILANHASLDCELASSARVISRLLPGGVHALFGPQHGYGGEDQDNMVETPHFRDTDLDVPVFSLYSGTREPTPSMLSLIDLLIIDLQDVGTRVYTFASTMFNCLKACAEHHKTVVVLDRPNPLGGDTVEGNILRPELYSFVGPFGFPMRHGLTMGEMAMIFNREFALGCDLDVVPMEGWCRKMRWSDTGLRWHMPSTNMPTADTAAVYPGQVLWEGTNVSEGRGTCRPFEMFGAPYLDAKAVRDTLDPRALAGCVLQDYTFRPTFHKWAGRLCRGFMIHVRNPRVYRPYFTSLSLLGCIMKLHREDFRLKDPPYEYEHKKKPIDLIMGDSSLRHEVESGVAVAEIQEKWLPELESFVRWRTEFLLYS